MKKLYSILALLLFWVTVSAQQSQQPKMVSVPEDQLTEQQKAAVKTNQTIETVGKYTGLGKEIGEAVNGTLSAIGHQADTISRTPVGRFAMIMIAYKVMGTDIIQFIIGIPLMATMLILSIVYYNQNIKRKRLLKREVTSKEGETQRDYEWSETDAGEKIIWLLCTIAVIGLSCAVIFAG